MGVFLRGFKFTFLFFCLGNLFAAELCATPAFPRPASVPEGLGFNIHFPAPLSGEMKMLAESGVRWVRMDLFWEFSELNDGRYDFSAAERLVSSLASHKIRVLFILFYCHPLYDRGKRPFIEEGLRAFARWAAAAVKHFQGRGIIWEMWNEPNLGLFWGPKPSVDDYILLTLEVGKAVQKGTP